MINPYEEGTPEHVLIEQANIMEARANHLLQEINYLEGEAAHKRQVMVNSHQLAMKLVESAEILSSNTKRTVA